METVWGIFVGGLKIIPLAIIIAIGFIIALLIIGFPRVVSSILLGTAFGLGLSLYFLHFPVWLAFIICGSLITLSAVFSKFKPVYAAISILVSVSLSYINYLLINDIFPFNSVAKIIFLIIVSAVYFIVHIKGYEKNSRKRFFSNRDIYSKTERALIIQSGYEELDKGLKIKERLDSCGYIDEEAFKSMKKHFDNARKCGVKSAVEIYKIYENFGSLEEYYKSLDNDYYYDDDQYEDKELHHAATLFMIDDLENVSLDDLKKRRNELIKTFHSDNRNVSEDSCSQKINDAYEVLK